jgi:hypothetical protein
VSVKSGAICIGQRFIRSFLRRFLRVTCGNRTERVINILWNRRCGRFIAQKASTAGTSCYRNNTKNRLFVTYHIVNMLLFVRFWLVNVTQNPLT